MEFDIFIPSLELAVEYQGQQHYEWNFRVGGSHLKQQKRDLEKQQVIYPFIYLSSIYPSVHLFVYLSIGPSIINPLAYLALFSCRLVRN